MDEQEKILKFREQLKQKEDLLLAKIEDPITEKIIKFSLKGETTYYRAKTLFTKEPETIDWIRKFEKDSVFYDIGANVGVYSLFSSLVSKSKTYSFEPEANNFQVLMENLYINNLNKLVTPYPIGISDKTELSKLNLSKFESGQSHHTVGEFALDHNTLSKIPSVFTQGVFSTTIDDLWNRFNLPIPNYIKIDVDGIELKIINGAIKTLKNQDLKSVLVEINPKRNEDEEILKIFNFYKFTYDSEQVNKTLRKDGPHEGYAEYIFFRG
tara:strand:- start:103 stop:906 length:804 start_codon:yes stop_codon:yes gene_type:complete